jgi:tRNA(Ile2) C34 agmatinyltransferase TiaS
MTDVTMWQSKRLCPVCKTNMNTDGKSFWCPGCGLTLKKKPKKFNQRTARDIREAL